MGRHSEAFAGRTRRRRSQSFAGAHGSGCIRASDRLCQYGQPGSGKNGRTAKGDCGSLGAGRVTRAYRAAGDL